MNNKIDLSKFLHKPEDYNHIDVTSEVVRDAINRVALLNEKTAEQVIIVKQQEEIELSQHTIDKLQKQLEDNIKRLNRLKVHSANAVYRLKRDGNPYGDVLERIVKQTDVESVKEIESAVVDKFARYLIAKHGISDNGRITVDHIVEYVNEYNGERNESIRIN